MTHAFVGMRVLYRLTEADAEAINKRRQEPTEITVTAPLALPMTVVQVWGSKEDLRRQVVDGQVLLPGCDSLWVTNIPEGEDPGQWEPILHG